MNKELIEQFLLEKYHQIGEGPFLPYLSELFLKTKAGQKAEFDAWVVDRKARVQADLDALEARKIATQDVLQAELNKLETAK